MNTSYDQCPKCGATLPVGTSLSQCPKCLLQAGLDSGTDFHSAALSETLPPLGHQASMLRDSNSGELSDDAVDYGKGLGAYRELQAVHDWSGGTVYRAIHRQLDRPVLLRVLDSSADKDACREFLGRAEKLSQLNHPNTVGTLEAGVDNEVAYVAEEFVDGQPLSGFLPRNRQQRWAEGFFPNIVS